MTQPIHTRTFKSGNSVAVRLPKELGVGLDTAVTIERTGDALTIRALHDPDHERAELARLIADLRAIGEPPGGVQPRIPFEWIDRPGL